MPHYSFPVTQAGPLIQVHVGVSQPRKAALQAAGAPVPLPVPANMLVDTGASCTNVDARILGNLSVGPTGSVHGHTPSTGTRPVTFLTYDVEIRLNGSGQHIPSISVIESDFSAQGLDGLLGRDFLQFARMTYLGPENHVYISF